MPAHRDRHQSRTKTSFLEVPYKGVAPALTDITGQHLDLTFAPLAGPILELIKSGKVNAIAVASQKRLGTTGSDLVIAPFTILSAKYRPDSFRLLGVVGSSDFVLVSSTVYPFKTIDELIDF